jgi:signal transduction histidine kinase
MIPDRFTKRILSVEDDPGLSLLLQKQLQRRGYIVDTAADGEEGIAAVTRNRYDLLLIDYTMPGCGGIGMIRTLADRESLPPTIMVTGDGNVEVAVEALKLGASDYIVKDAEMQYLELLPAVIEQVLERQRLMREKQQMLVAIQDSEERYRRLFDMNPIPMWVAERETGAVLEVNRAATEHYGFSREEFLALTRGDIEIPPLPGGSGGLRRPMLVRHRKKNGDVIEVESVTHQMAFAGRQADVFLNSDITERKRLEEERIRNQKLEALGTLAGGLAHDFNNILTTILGNISIIRMDFLSGRDIIDRLDALEKASLRARDLSSQLLTFSRGGAPVKRMTDLRPLLREAADFALRGSRSHADYAISDDLASAEVDEGQIRQVVSSLIGNAAEAMPDGGRVTVRAENVTLGPDSQAGLGAGPYIKITVADQGPGIPPEVREKIFDPYFTTSNKASGLGLATSYSILRRHNGLVCLDETGVKGSTFAVFLPAAMANTGVVIESRAANPAAAVRVLVMDDDPTVLEVAGLMLESLGYEVTPAKDGDEAIALYGQAKQAGSPYDLVIMDLTVHGGMGGTEAVARLRESDPAVRAIVSSGYSSDPVMSEYQRYGFSGVVPKPYTLEGLKDAVEGVLKD